MKRKTHFVSFSYGISLYLHINNNLKILSSLIKRKIQVVSIEPWHLALPTTPRRTSNNSSVHDEAPSSPSTLSTSSWSSRKFSREYLSLPTVYCQNFYLNNNIFLGLETEPSSLLLSLRFDPKSFQQLKLLLDSIGLPHYASKILPILFVLNSDLTYFIIFFTRFF